MPIPMRERIDASATIMRSTSSLEAPSAILIPISAVRWETEWAMRPETNGRQNDRNTAFWGPIARSVFGAEHHRSPLVTSYFIQYCLVNG
jgi:hypothetical protein